MRLKPLLKQTCVWTRRSDDYDEWGNPTGGIPESISCRWVGTSSIISGSMGPEVLENNPSAKSLTTKVLVAKDVRAGDILTYQGVDHVVLMAQEIRDPRGRFIGKTVYC